MDGRKNNQDKTDWTAWANVARRRDACRLHWLSVDLPSLRKAVFAALRKAGFRRSGKSPSGSAYYERLDPDGKLLRVRVSDHELRMTDARQHAWDQGEWWALDIVLNRDADLGEILEDIAAL